MECIIEWTRAKNVATVCASMYLIINFLFVGKDGMNEVETRNLDQIISLIFCGIWRLRKANALMNIDNS